MNYTARQWLRIGAMLIPLLILWASVSWLSYRVWVRGADHRDFYPRWAGVRRLLSGSRDLYSDDATRAIQVDLYGAPLPPDQDQQGFAYPAQLAVLLIPFGLIGDVEIATAVWQGLSVVLLLSALLFLRRHASDQVPAYVVPAFICWPYTLLMLFQGQVTVIPFAAIAGATVAFLRRRDILAGIVLSASIVKPELAIVPIVALTVLSLCARRIGFLLGLLTGSLLLLTASLILAGWWLPQWIASLARYASYAKVVWPLREIWRINPLLTMGFLSALTISMHFIRRGVIPTVSIAVPAGMLLLPQTLPWGLTMLAIPLMLSWTPTGRAAVPVVWLLGWIAMFTAPLPDWWRVHAVAMPMLSIIVTFAAYGPFLNKGDTPGR